MRNFQNKKQKSQQLTEISQSIAINMMREEGAIRGVVDEI
jgi:hypothetical protein